MSVWRSNPDLIVRLTTAQNHPANLSQDIMTIAGCFDSRSELMAHVARYELKAAVYVAPVKAKRGRKH